MASRPILDEVESLLEVVEYAVRLRAQFDSSVADLASSVLPDTTMDSRKEVEYLNAR